MALVLHRWGEMGKHAMSLLLRLALHSGEDRHLRRITIIIIIIIINNEKRPWFVGMDLPGDHDLL